MAGPDGVPPLLGQCCWGQDVADHHVVGAVPALGWAQWQEVVGTVTTTETSTPYDVVRATTVLTDDAEEAQGH